MQTIPLDTSANQSLTITIDGNRWVLRLKECLGCMVMDITLNEAPLLLGQRVVAGSPVIPYAYLQRWGNFWFLTENDMLPYWTNFNIDQQLIYAAPGELPNG